jgi:hypothetical protein
MHQILTKRIEVGTRTAIVIFGTMSGLIWSVIGGGLLSGDMSSGEDATVLGAGVITGILVSFMLKSVLSKCGRFATLGYGLLSLPVGAFAFGFIASLIQIAVKAITGVSYSLTTSFNPFEAGILFALVSVMSILAVVYLPLAVLTTFLLRAVIIRGIRHDHAV